MVRFGFAAVATGLLMAGQSLAETPAVGAWVPDQGQGIYRNPVLNGDYSDPDAIRVGDDFYLVSSSFVNVPGLPILHSKDLVNWEIIGHALDVLPPEDHFRTPRRGGGVWAPAIRHHNGRYFIYYPDPDFGIFVISAADPKGPWTKPVLVDDARGAIDPCPFWDDDGKGWLVHAYAASRAGGRNNQVVLKRLNADGTHTDGAEQILVDGRALTPVETSLGPVSWFTIEGPKLYKRDGYYYIFAPAGGVKNGWQAVFRSKAITGPYEARNVMDQGATPGANGPHQGAWVDTASGEDWFLHFQDADSYGRRVWLEPMQWKDGWPVIGQRQKGKVFGQPVLSYRKPKTAPQPASVPVSDDDFDRGFNMAWQWNANPGDDWADTVSQPGWLRLKSISSSANLYEAGNELTQKLPNTTFSAVTKMTFNPRWEGERAGLVLLGYSYGFIGLENTRNGVVLEQVTRMGADTNGTETKVVAPEKITGEVWLKASLTPVVTSAEPPAGYLIVWPAMRQETHAKVTFGYSLDGRTWTPLGDGFVSQPSRWVGAQIGLFAQSPSGTPSNVSTRVGYAAFDSFHIEANQGATR